MGGGGEVLGLPLNYGGWLQRLKFWTRGVNKRPWIRVGVGVGWGVGFGIFGYKQGLSVEVADTLCSDQGSSTFNGITEVTFKCTSDLQGDVKIQRAADSYGFRCAIANETRMTCVTSTSF